MSENLNRNGGFSSIKKSALVFVFFMVAIITLSFALAPNITEGETDPAAAPVVAEKVLIPGGHCVGVKMDVKGVLIVGLEDIETVTGEVVNPGLLSGLQIGDTILEINGTKVYRASEVQALINRIRGDVSLKVQRKDKILEINLVPVIADEDGLYKLGIWVKDKTAGIGTLTYYDPDTKKFGALGHAITDPETGAVLDVAEGELLNSQVQSVKEGRAGDPGEIRGIFYEADSPLGSLSQNTVYGIFGTMYKTISNPLYEKPLAIAKQDQVQKGPAYILTTLDGNKIEKYEVEIEKINRQTEPDTKSMVIHVTDKRLLEKSGGIIQGMSGSPIIQNNRIIGAVTHVFVNNPEKGYAIFIEWMLSGSGD